MGKERKSWRGDGAEGVEEAGRLNVREAMFTSSQVGRRGASQCGTGRQGLATPDVGVRGDRGVVASGWAERPSLLRGKDVKRCMFLIIV